MYKLADIRDIHFEITSKCQAACPMCARNIQGGPKSPFLELNEISYDQFQKWFDIAFVKQLDKLYMCGNFGDPVTARDTLEIFTYLRFHNPNMVLSMNTNGSAKSESFWRRLADLNVDIRFGIDGLEDTHSRYRINTNWQKIIQNAKTFINNGGYAVWDMLVFDHNKHQVEDCRQLSKELGFKEFFHKNTSRFRDNSLTVIDANGIKVDELFPTEKSIQHRAKVNTDSKIIDCKAKKENSIYIGANGNVTACCWTDLQFIPPHNDSRVDITTRIGSAPNLYNSSLREIFNSNYFNSIQDTWGCDPLKECAKQCGSFKKFEAQYEN
jgi:MoaA/NifB/PqqE/SkfB family radical SAM enzyme